MSRYWQRYCAKTETIGFFGPILWVTLDPQAPDVTAVPGPRLLAERRVFLEPWAVAAYGRTLAEDPDIRVWLPPAPLPHHALEGDLLLRPGWPARRLTPAQAAVYRACDGHRPAVEVVAGLAADPRAGFTDEAEIWQILGELVNAKLLTWDANLPFGVETEQALTERIAAIGDERVRRRAAEGLRRLHAARDAVAAASGDPEALSTALTALDREFTAVTGLEPRRRSGRTYAGRGVCYEDTTRDLKVVIGAGFLDRLAGPLSVVLQAARWLTVELAGAYEDALRKLYDDLAGDGKVVRLSDLWDRALALFWGKGDRPVDAVVQEFSARWRKLLATSGPETRVFPADELAERVHDVFPADRPGWSAGRIHSPDLQIAAASVDALNRGDHLVVLGEIHTALATLTGRAYTWMWPDPDRILTLVCEDYGQRRLVPLYPTAWPGNAGRLVISDTGPADWLIGFAPAPGVDRERLVPITGVHVTLAESRLTATTPDGRRWPLIEVFSSWLSAVASDVFKVPLTAGHSPRVTIDHLVVFRETWRTTVAETGLVEARGELEEYLAARRWRQRLGLPERCFVKIENEVKPCYVDLTSPLYVSSLCAMLRAAYETHGGDLPVIVTEMLPTPDQAWVPDASGDRYFGELRIHVTDPQGAYPTSTASGQDGKETA